MTSLSNKVHWGHGIALGAVFGLISLVGFTGFADHHIFCTVLTGDALLYAALGVLSPGTSERVDLLICFIKACMRCHRRNLSNHCLLG